MMALVAWGWSAVRSEGCVIGDGGGGGCERDDDAAMRVGGRNAGVLEEVEGNDDDRLRGKRNVVFIVVVACNNKVCVKDGHIGYTLCTVLMMIKGKKNSSGQSRFGSNCLWCEEERDYH